MRIKSFILASNIAFLIALVSSHASAQTLSLEYNNAGDRKSLAGEERGGTNVSENTSVLQLVPADGSQAVSSSIVSYNTSSRVSDRINTSYSVGSIPVTSGVTPSGGRTYSIPIPTAPGYNLVPEISLVYNSQGGRGIAGEGWDIAGLSCITPRNKSFYFDSTTVAAKYDDVNAAFALDGVPLIPDALASSMGYSYSTRTGHVLVKKYTGSQGKVLYFTALYPNGCQAVYGFENSTSSQAYYPLTYIQDSDGNSMSFQYSQSTSDGRYLIQSITYGSSNATRIEFRYGNRDDYYLYKTFAGKNIRESKLLISVASYSNEGTLSRDTLFHSNRYGTCLLDSLCRYRFDDVSSSEVFLNPLRFEYGNGTGAVEDTTFSLVNSSPAAIPFSPDSALLFRRGKLVPGQWKDGCIILPEHDTYTELEKHTWWSNTYRLYGSSYPDTAHIYIAPIAGEQDSCQYITVGSGFYGIQAIDINGDGRDEIVRASIHVLGSQTILRFIISGFDSSLHYSDLDTVDVTFNCVHQEDMYKSPVELYLDYGDFTGRGKIEALAVVADPENGGGTTKIIDLDMQNSLFNGTLNLPYRDTVISFCYDLDGDGKTEYCRAEPSKLKVYRFNGSAFDSTNVFSFDKDKMSRCLAYGDINGDGYFDAVVKDNNDKAGSTIICYYFDGASFLSESCNISYIRPDDKYSLMDINSDGLPELVRLRSATTERQAFFYRNTPSGYQATFSPARRMIIGFNNKTHLIPCNLISYGGEGSVITFGNGGLRVYKLNNDRAALRLMTSLTDSYGMNQENTYKNISNLSTDDDTYSIDTNRSYTTSEGYCRLTPPIRVLAQTATYIPGSSSALDSLRYRYRDAVFHQRGLGFRGFGETTVINSTRNTTDARLFTTTVYDPENSGVVLNVYKRLANESAEPFETITNTWQKIFRPYAKHIPRLRASYTESPLTGFATSESYTYDNLDFVKTVSSDKTELGEWRRRHSQQSSSSEQANSAVNSEENPSYLQVITTNTYSHLTDSNTGKYILGRITKCIEERGNDIESGEISWRGETVTTFQTNGVHPVNVKHYVGWDDDSRARLLDKETCYTYDNSGNVTSVKSAPYGATAESAYTGEEYGYDNAGRFMTSKTDALGRVTQYSGYNSNVFGKPTTVTDCRGNVTSYDYDALGNPLTVESPEGRRDTTILAWNTNGPAGAVYTVTMRSNAAPTQTSYYDALGREIRSATTRFDNSVQKVDRTYTTTGEVYTESLPYKGSVVSASMLTTYGYDAYGRPVSCSEPSGRQSLWSYDGRSTTSTIDSVTSTKVIGSDDNIESATDAGGTITYAYNANGTLSSMTAPGNVTTTFSYDSYGRRSSMNDPSAGPRSDSYAVYGTRHTQTSSKGTVQTWTDYTGRVTEVYRTSTEAGASDAGSFNTSYTYNAYGDLTDVISTNGTLSRYTYDTYGRPLTAKDSADGKWLLKEYAYNSTGQLSSTTYTASSGLSVTESYTYANGWKTQTTAGGNIIWRLDAENDLGQPTQATTGSITRTYSFNSYGLPTGRTMGSVMNFGYSYAGTTGNMLSRTDNTRNLTETFTYDSLDRLVSSSGNTADTRTFTYANNGNITQIGGLGTLSHSDSSHPYRVTGGNVTGMDGFEYTIKYTSFDRPAAMEPYNAELSSREEIGFVYNASHERVKTEVSYEDETKGIRIQWSINRWYLGGRYELEETSESGGEESRSTTIKERLYLGGDAYSAPVVAMRTNNSGNCTYYNIGRDVQGSITHIATMSGTLVAEYSYDPWGRLRNPATHALYDVLSTPDLMLGRGYTGHEYIPEAGLWNANARLYDPFLGCFLSPDPYVQAPDFTQNLNRYAYALNNPLKYSDESGEFLTWNLSLSGFSIGLNFTPCGVPLGFGLNIGWSGGFSLGIYGEVGYRVGGTGIGSGATISKDITYNFSTDSWSSYINTNLYASLGPISASAGISYNRSDVSGSFCLGVGVGNDARGGALAIGYGTGGFSLSIGGYYNSHAWDSNPIYEPEKWNQDLKSLDWDNCYSYALDDYKNGIGARPQPGQYSGDSFLIPKDYSDVSLDVIIEAAVRDGRIKVPSLWNLMGFGKKGYYSAYLVQGLVGDYYHWYRQDKGGLWSHKPGLYLVTNLDGRESLILNPRFSNHTYNYPVTYNDNGHSAHAIIQYVYSNKGRLLWIKK